LRPAKNRGKGFDKVADQNSPYFHRSNYTLNKTFSLEEEKAQNRRGKLESKIGRNLSQKLGVVAPDFDSRFGGIEATEHLSGRQASR